MASVNKVILLGNLGRDPEVRYLPSGDPVANITIATSSRYKNKAGEMVDETEWHRVTFFGRLAEIASQYLRKGRPVYVEGRIKTNKYTDKNGVERYSTDVIASEMQLLGDREGRGEPSQGEDDGGYSRQAPAPRLAPAPARQPSAAPAPAARPASGFDDMDDDIPF
ncbi:MAG: single-stranded DNA-binding protein [Rhodoferax sp.]|nr:single-stranded DNA-binding protein [Rhodoferax sp.]NCP82249.1 single-stranded DNA-binding protein [Rhodoferax sp.]PIZ23609.1 MAG: single-stranded DNA-binding protein [Comamonadaceae bacterium CG_4_10_14_0_8_um_filter_57_29]PJC12877.1 MAG: single-stranded DNA-binding protein [Comamonadaceae bacterium CG_4_9_14_0_8_um_filter_57_21]